MQQASLELLQRNSPTGAAAAASAEQQEARPAAAAPASDLAAGGATVTAPLPQQPATPPGASAGDMFGGMGAYYGLPSGGGGAAAQQTAFANNGPSAFSPILPLHSAGVAAANAFSMQRQPSDAWNVSVAVCAFIGCTSLPACLLMIIHAW